MPSPMPPAAAPELELTATEFSRLKGWNENNPNAALTAFQRSCTVIASRAADQTLGGLGYAGTPEDWREVCRQAGDMTTSDPAGIRAFFTGFFTPYRVGGVSAEGLFTGYYEPELHGSRTRHGAYQTPVYALPSDLVSVDLGLFRKTLMGERLAGRVVNGRLVPYPNRADIMARGLESARTLFFVDDPLDAFFLHIQGSGRVRLDDGTSVRAAFAGQNGQPYTAIGAILIRRGELTREEVSLPSIRAWLASHPDEAVMLMNANASYVFFSERAIGDEGLGATGSEGVPLSPEASLAVDGAVHALGVPVWLDTEVPDPDANKPVRPFERLLIMQDTGGAIRGAVRGDVYWGYGAAAGAIAGRMRSQGRMTVLLPKTLAAKLGSDIRIARPQ